VGGAILIQAMDAREAASSRRESGVNPQVGQVAAVHVPLGRGLDHGLSLASQREAAGTGADGIFNQLHYEEVLRCWCSAPGVHRASGPVGHRTEKLWDQRFKQIRKFERHCRRMGHGSHVITESLAREQKRRFLQRSTSREEMEFNVGDLKERPRWKETCRRTRRRR